MDLKAEGHISARDICSKVWGMRMRDTIGHLCNIKLYWDVCAIGTYRMLTVFIDVFMYYFQVYVVTYLF